VLLDEVEELLVVLDPPPLSTNLPTKIVTCSVETIRLPPLGA